MVALGSFCTVLSEADEWGQEHGGQEYDPVFIRGMVQFRGLCLERQK